MNDSTLSKSCSRCGETKPRSAFSMRRASVDGLQPKCKSCERERKAELRSMTPEDRAAERASRIAPSKSCIRCGQVKALSQFKERPGAVDGTRGTCRECWNANHRQKYAKTPIPVQARERRRASMSAKVCSSCRQALPLSAFHRDKYARDGLTFQCSKCRDAATARWRVENRERILEISRQYRRNNAEKVSAASRKWQRENPERVRETRRARYWQSRELINAKRKAWRSIPEGAYQTWLSRTAEARREADAERARNSPKIKESRRIHASRRRARHRAALVELFQANQVPWTGVCCICSGPMTKTSVWPDPLSPTLEHLVPISRGGSHALGNVDWAHFVCNARKNNRLLAELDQSKFPPIGNPTT